MHVKHVNMFQHAHFEPRFQGKGVVPRKYFLVSTKLDTFCYLTVHTAPCYVQSVWHNTGVWQTDRQTDKPVGFYGPIVPPVPNAPSSECPRASIAGRRRAAGSIRKCRRASCCCSSAIAGIAIGANFKIYLLRQFCSNRVEFFYNTQETQTQKWWTRIMKFKFCDFWQFV